VSDGDTESRRPGGRGQAGHRPPAEVLADRIAAALARHEPGWRLPGRTVLARRYRVSTAEIEVALGELAARHLIRRQPDGQLYRVSPAEYLIPLEGMPGLGTLADPMGGQIVCQSRQSSLTEVPGDIGRALRVPPAAEVAVIRTQWRTARGEPAACCTTYLIRDIAAPFLDPGEGGGTAVSGAPLPVPVPAAGGARDLAAIGRPGAVHLELRPPPAALARRLQLAAGQPAVLVTTRFDDLERRRPVALATAVLRPDWFRVVLHAPERPLAAWAHAPGNQRNSRD
jgi:DNA-binding GntR family transcriptional regulator